MTLRSFVVSKEKLSSVSLCPNSDLQRVPPRPLDLRQANYNDMFDFHTLFFDCFFLPSGALRFLGPPPMNLRKPLDDCMLSIGGSVDRVGAHADLAFRQIRKTFRMDWSGKGSAADYKLSMENGTIFEGVINPNECEIFDGKRVLFTMVKYDAIEWIVDWVTFYVKAHGVDAVLIYNNDAPDFSSQDLADALGVIERVDVVGVVDWFFPYGPGEGESGLWDSAFTQQNGMEHARFRYLAKARCVVNSDVDELVFCERPKDTVCSLVEQANSGFIRYLSSWVAGEFGPDLSVPKAERRYRNSYYVEDDWEECGAKWSVVPAKCPDNLAWGVHSINQMPIDSSLSKLVGYRHMPEFNARWKRESNADKLSYVSDEIMIRTYRTIGWL